MKDIHGRDVVSPPMKNIFGRSGAADEDLDKIARVYHAAITEYCAAGGDGSQNLPWEEAPDWQKSAMRAGVQYEAIRQREGHRTTPRVAHNVWVEERKLAGWKSGPEMDLIKKEDPALVPFGELPAEERMKHHLASHIVQAFFEFSADEKDGSDNPVGEASHETLAKLVASVGRVDVEDKDPARLAAAKTAWVLKAEGALSQGVRSGVITSQQAGKISQDMREGWNPAAEAEFRDLASLVMAQHESFAEFRSSLTKDRTGLTGEPTLAEQNAAEEKLRAAEETDAENRRQEAVRKADCERAAKAEADAKAAVAARGQRPGAQEKV